MVNYVYLGEQIISIKGPTELINRVSRNFEESPIEIGNPVGEVIVEEGDYVEFSRDRSKPYMSTRPNTSRAYPGVDFLRYGVHVRTVWKRDNFHFEAKNFQPFDETLPLSCFKKIYYSTPSSQNKALIHGSLVEVNGQGVLTTGKCWSGKTSLTMAFLERFNGRFVSDGNILLSYQDGNLVGNYLPRPVYVRFSSISTSARLSEILKNPCQAEAIQFIDREAIEEAIARRNFLGDMGISFSRKKFLELMGIQSLPSLIINRIIYSRFSEDSAPDIGVVDISEGCSTIQEREFLKEIGIGNIKNQRDIKPPANSIIQPKWLEGLALVKVSFDAKKDLTGSLLEDLL